MIQWDSSGLRGTKSKYEITLIPAGEGWSSVVWVNKTHLITINPVESKNVAKATVEMYLDELDKTTRRFLERIRYDEDEKFEEEIEGEEED